MEPESIRVVTKVVRLTAAAECDERAGQIQRANAARSEAGLLIANLLPVVVAHPSGQGPAGNGIVLFLLSLLVENGHEVAAQGSQLWRKKADRLASLLLVPLYTFASLSTTPTTTTTTTTIPNDGTTTSLCQSWEATRHRLAQLFLAGLHRGVTAQLLEEMKLGVGVPQTGGPSTRATGNYQVVNDIDSMERIVSYVATALAYDPQVAEDGLIVKYAIERAVQVAGEYLKNTSASPNLSEERRMVLLRDHVPTAKLSELRDTMSHATTLLCVTRRRLEGNSEENSRLFRDLQWDLRKVSKVLTKVIHALRVHHLTMFASALSERPEYQPIRHPDTLTPSTPPPPSNDSSTTTTTPTLTEAGILATALDHLKANHWPQFLHTILQVESEQGLPWPVGTLAVVMRNTAAIIEFLEEEGRRQVQVDRPWLLGQVATRLATNVEAKKVPGETSVESAKPSESVTCSVVSSCVAFTDLDERLYTPVTLAVDTQDTSGMTPAQLYEGFVRRLDKAGEKNPPSDFVLATLLLHRNRYEARTSLLGRRDGDSTSQDQLDDLLERLALQEERKQERVRDAATRFAWSEVLTTVEPECAAYKEFLRLVRQANQRVVSLREVRQLSKAFWFPSGQQRVTFEGAFATYREEIEHRSRASVVDSLLVDTLARLEQSVNATDAQALQVAIHRARPTDHYRHLVAALGQNEREVLGRTAFRAFIDALPGVEAMGRQRLYDAFGRLQEDFLQLYYLDVVETLKGVLRLDGAAQTDFAQGERRWANGLVERVVGDAVLRAGLEMMVLNLLSTLKDIVWQDGRAYRATERLIKRAVSMLDLGCAFGEHVPLRNYLAHGDWLLDTLHAEGMPRFLAWTAVVLATEGENVLKLLSLVASRRATGLVGGIGVPDAIRRSPFWMGVEATWSHDLALVRLPSWRPNEAQGMANVYADAGERLWKRSLDQALIVANTGPVTTDEQEQGGQPSAASRRQVSIDFNIRGNKQ